MSVFSLMLLTLSSPQTPPELGTVHWHRDYAAAQQRAKTEGKPLLILFDEVPGCQTCVRYGQSVLSHPLLVEAAETAFVPVAVYNNVGGADRKVLNRYREPTWNNPVVRIVTANEKPLTSRLAGDYSQHGLAKAMRQSLQAAGRPVPSYLSHLEADLAPKYTARVVLSMYCFWSGEACLTGVSGVVSTRPGFMEGREVVEVTYDERATSLSEVLKAAKSRGCADHVFVKKDDQLAVAKAVFKDRASTSRSRFRYSEKDDKYHLANSAWRYVPMTPRQAQVLNASLARGRAATDILSPRQQKIARAVGKSPRDGWTSVVPRGDWIAAFDRAWSRVGGR